MRTLGDLTTSLELVVRLAQAQDEGVYRDEHSALAKAVCTYRMREAVGWAREILGGHGIVLDYNVGRFVADAEESLRHAPGGFPVRSLAHVKSVTATSTCGHRKGGVQTSLRHPEDA